MGLPHHDEQTDLIIRWVDRWRAHRDHRQYEKADGLRRFLGQMGVRVSTGGWRGRRVYVVWEFGVAGLRHWIQ